MVLSKNNTNDNFFNFSISFNQSFLSDAQNKSISFREHKFDNADIDLDLLDYCDFTTNNIQSKNLTLISSYFRHKSSSLENLNLNFNRQPSLCKANQSSERNSFLFDNFKSKSLTNLNKATSVKYESICLTIARYSKFDFDFLNFANLNDYEIPVHFKYFIDQKLTKYSFKIKKSKVCFFPKLKQQVNLASLISYESGKYLIQLCCFILIKKRSIPFLLNCYLNVVDLDVHRPFSNQKLIKLSCFESIQSEQQDLFFRISNLNLDSCFVLKIHLEEPIFLVTLDKSLPLLSSENIKYQLINQWTCLITFLRPEDFIVKILITKQSDIKKVSKLSFYICDSIDQEKCVLLNDFKLEVNFYEINELSHSCVQIYFEEGNGLNFSKWKRVFFRNKLLTKRVKIRIRLTVDDKEITYPNWKCTKAQFMIEPLSKEAVFVFVNKRVLKGDINTPLPSIALLVDQFAGKGKVVTSIVNLTLMD